jgi:large subunit ribosomal protein L10
MKKSQKESSIDLAKKIFTDNSAIILLNYKGLNAKGMYLLRKNLKGKGANIKIFKNTLIKRAMVDDAKVLLDDFKDQVAVSYSNDPVALSSVLIKFVNENETVGVKVGFLNGEVVTLDTIKSMSSLGSIEEVRAKFIGLLKAPGSKLARTLKAQETELNKNAS